MNPTEQKLSKALTMLIMREPFFASLAMGREYIPKTVHRGKPIKKGATNGKQVFYNPNFINGASLNDIEFFLAHEIMHISQLHHTRQGLRDLKIWNEACDYAINPLLVDSGFKLLEGALFREDFRDMSAEMIYRKLQDEQKPPQPKGEPEQEPEEDQDDEPEEEQEPESEGQDDDQQNDDDKNSDDNGDTGNEDDQPDEEDSDGNEEGDDQTDDKSSGNDTGEGDDSDQESEDSQEGDESGEGQGDNNEPDGSEEEDDDPGGCGGVEPPPQLSEAEKEEEEQEVRGQVAQAMNNARREGKLPGFLERAIKRALEPKVDWQEVLARFLSEVVRDDYTFSRPNPRFIHTGFFMPYLQNETVGDIVMIVDTSMSINEELLNKFGGEMQEVVNTFGKGFHVVYVDTEVKSTEYVEPDGEVDLHPSGGGGTDFKPGFEWIDQEDIRPKAVVYFTDGICSSYPEIPDYPVLWAVYGWYADEFKPPFGEVVSIME